jgi:hypothetical protein
MPKIGILGMEIYHLVTLGATHLMLHNVPSFGDALVAFNVVVELALLHVGLDDSANLGVNVMILKYFRQKMD